MAHNKICYIYLQQLPTTKISRANADNLKDVFTKVKFLSFYPFIYFIAIIIALILLATQT